MTKILLIVVLMISFSSCGVLRAPEYVDLIRNITFGAEDITVNQKFYDDQTFSFAKVSLGRSKIAIVTLGYVEDNILQWFTSSQSAIYTQNGKIISLVDFSNDMRSISSKEIQFQKNAIQTNSLNIHLKDPEGFFTQDALLNFNKSEEILYLQNQLSVDLYTEEINTNGLKWRFVNKYWVDPTSGLVIKSEQTVHPRLPKITITYYYKYLD